MAIDYNRDREVRTRGYERSSASAFIIGAVVLAALLAMLMFFTLGDRTPTGSTVTSTPSTAPTTQPRTAPPPAATKPSPPAPAPSTK